MSYRTKSIIAFLVFIAAVLLMTSGEAFLSRPMFYFVPMPWGNWITWVGFIAFPLSIYYGFSAVRRPKKRFMGLMHILLKLNLILAILWVPISYLLAGNITNSFSGSATGFQGSPKASEVFWGFNIFLIFLPFSILSAVGIQTVINLLKSKNNR